jgi:hypothetical protein
MAQSTNNGLFYSVLSTEEKNTLPSFFSFTRRLWRVIVVDMDDMVSASSTGGWKMSKYTIAKRIAVNAFKAAGLVPADAELEGFCFYDALDGATFYRPFDGHVTRMEWPVDVAPRLPRVVAKQIAMVA